MLFQTFFIDYIAELKRVVNNIRERNAKNLGNEDWELFRQTIRILEICGKQSSMFQSQIEQTPFGIDP